MSSISQNRFWEVNLKFERVYLFRIWPCDSRNQRNIWMGHTHGWFQTIFSINPKIKEGRRPQTFKILKSFFRTLHTIVPSIVPYDRTDRIIPYVQASYLKLVLSWNNSNCLSVVNTNRIRYREISRNWSFSGDSIGTRRMNKV